jgi:hypothetical protein
MAKITIKELESLTATDVGRILREGGNLAGRISMDDETRQAHPRGRRTLLISP